jgi:hypothetical protein
MAGLNTGGQLVNASITFILFATEQPLSRALLNQSKQIVRNVAIDLFVGKSNDGVVAG